MTEIQTALTGFDLINEPMLNKGTAFTESERDDFALHGLLPPHIGTLEDQIARRLDTSRGPVREALRELEHEGLVVSYPYRGAVVLGVSDEEVQHVLIPIRLTLERYCFLKALERMTDEHRDLLAALQSRDPELLLAKIGRHIAVPVPAADGGRARKPRAKARAGKDGE